MRIRIVRATREEAMNRWTDERERENDDEEKQGRRKIKDGGNPPGNIPVWMFSFMFGEPHFAWSKICSSNDRGHDFTI